MFTNTQAPGRRCKQRKAFKMDKLQIKIKLDKGAYMPEKAHAADAGFDIRVPKGKQFRLGNKCKIFTGVHVEIPAGYYMSVENRSGLNFNDDITLHGTGTIDSGYTGEIGVKLYNDGSEEHIFKPGDKIAQLILHPFRSDVELIQVDNLDDTERGAGGFGSTGQ